MNNIKTLENTLKKAPLPNNSLTARKEWEQVVDNILASKPIVLNSTKTVDSSVVHLDPITVSKNSTLNYIESHISKDITHTALASGSIPMIGVRISFNEPISTKANANTWLIPNVVLEVQDQTINSSGTTLPVTSSEFSGIATGNAADALRSIFIGYNDDNGLLVKDRFSVGAFTGSMVQQPIAIHADFSYNGASGDTNIIGRGTQVFGRNVGYDRLQKYYGSFYTGSNNLTTTGEVQNPIFNNNIYLSGQCCEFDPRNFTQTTSFFTSNPNLYADDVTKEIVNAVNKSWNLRNFDEDTEIYVSLYFLSFEKDQVISGSQSPTSQDRFINELQAGTVGSYVNFTPLTIETPGEVTFSTTIINN